jgi:choline dehydrogenase-like flavoprotein
MKRAIVVGSGAGGATAAKELQGAFDVTVLEAGRDFRPFTMDLRAIERWKKSGLLFDARAIRLFFPTMKIRRTADGMILVNGIGVGGTTTIATGNGIRMDAGLRALGIDLDEEFDEIAREIPISTRHEEGWRPITRRLFSICEDLGLDPRPTPKMGDYERCAHCGRCIFGCPRGVKWDSRRFLDPALARGATLVTGCKVERVAIEGGRATGVHARVGRARRFYPADLVVLAAGGLATPVILESSGVSCEPRLFVDPVLCVAAEWKDAIQCFELEMPFVVQREGYIISPYFDFLSFAFNRAWRYPARDIVSVMVKLADTPRGSVTAKRVEKVLTAEDRARLDEGADLARAILARLGVAPDRTFLGTLNAGHPGGALPLTAREARSFHSDRLPANVYVADATLFPESLGNPPILTIIAMAKRVSRLCARRLAAGEL